MIRVMGLAAAAPFAAAGCRRRTTAARQHRGHHRLAVGVGEALCGRAGGFRCCRRGRASRRLRRGPAWRSRSRSSRPGRRRRPAAVPRRRFRGPRCRWTVRRGRSASRAMIHSSLRAPAGGVRARRRRRTRPSRLVRVPSSSAHWRTGRTRSAMAAVSDMKKSQTIRKSRLRRPSMTALASGEATAMLEAWTNRQCTPSGFPSDFSSCTAGRPGPGMSSRERPRRRPRGPGRRGR